jgi:branched-chain amino acid transport system ATP-binding protein
MSEPFLSIRNLEVRYGPALAVNGISLDVSAGESVAVLGSNGAGKSTLARAVSGLIPVTSGQIFFQGKDITKMAAHKVRQEGIVYLPEGRGIFPALTVTENLRLAACLLPRADRKAAVASGRELFPSLMRRSSAIAGTLSGGEQQMLSLCRALILTPKLIIADEMSLGLAPQLVDQVFESLRLLRESGATILLIEQFIHRALAFSDTALLLARGECVWSGSTQNAKEEIVARYLGETNPSAA